MQFGAVGVFAEHKSLRVEGQSLEHIVDFLANLHNKVRLASQYPDLVGIAKGADAAARPQYGIVIVVRIEHLVFARAG